MLERLLPWWPGKLFVLCLLGFVATDFIITITLSAADASAHALENPFVSHALAGQRVGVTLALIILLGLIFLRGFTEAIGIAVALVVPYLLLNAIVVGVSFGQVVQHPAVVVDWQQALVAEHGDPVAHAGNLRAAVSATRARSVGLRDRRDRHAPCARRDR